MSRPEFTHVFAALVALVNSIFFEVGQLFIRRIVWQFKSAYKRNDNPQLLNTVRFIAHLVNQKVVHGIIAIEILTVLLEKPSEYSVTTAVRFLVECGSMLQDVLPNKLYGVFDLFCGILYEGRFGKNAEFMIKKLLAIRKRDFQVYPANRQPELDFVEDEDKLTHEVSLDEDIDPEFSLDVFKLDPYFAMNEKFYEGMKKDLIFDDEESDEDQESGSDIESDEESEGDQASSGKVSNSDTRSSHSSDSANSDENGRKRKRN
ncbi:pre-mRNA-splicing factor cwc22 [Trifolium pratense]|uniref:Pre-mRNA-splicing factor cwc22 n=1 Tax=Trifolium pratense TaxID=57577 RepID=A0A2K3JL61_TRIPR|nr:pre-mRNA-splicing factor cwc22 [Trifolium pratense]